MLTGGIAFPSLNATVPTGTISNATVAADSNETMTNIGLPPTVHPLPPRTDTSPQALMR